MTATPAFQTQTTESPQPQHDAPMSPPTYTPQAPSKASLKAWWKQFTSVQKSKRPSTVQNKPTHNAVFGAPLRESLHYASVQISTANANGELYVWGYIPVVVAKCGLYLKENATEVEGAFRVSGSTKRMRDLQAVFERPPKYGKNLDWKQENYTSHDVATVFRRYLTQMPEPVIPYDLYAQFREALANKKSVEEVVKIYKQLIRSMPRANQYLLLYVLDLLSVFARKSDKNLMTATNLAVIFRPGLISHPNHELSPQEHQLSQDVLEFLIAHQDWFMLDIPPPPTTKGAPNSPITSQSQQQPPSPASPGTEDDLIVVPSSDDDQGSPGGGWKLVERSKKKPDRRRTTSEKPREEGSSTLKSPVITSAELSPVVESSSVLPEETGGAELTRRRTAPSRRGATKDGYRSGDEQRPANVLRKQKRQSMTRSSLQQASASSR